MGKKGKKKSSNDANNLSGKRKGFTSVFLHSRYKDYTCAVYGLNVVIEMCVCVCVLRANSSVIDWRQ